MVFKCHFQKYLELYRGNIYQEIINMYNNITLIKAITVITTRIRLENVKSKIQIYDIPNPIFIIFFSFSPNFSIIINH
jgi:hypothetical protein